MEKERVLTWSMLMLDRGGKGRFRKHPLRCVERAGTERSEKWEMFESSVAKNGR